MARNLATMTLVLAAVVAAASESRADGNWFWGGGIGYNRLYRSDREIPYFAEHPPVYYSHIVPRSYGQSPYAYWPGPFTPMLTPEPIYVPNPYVPEGEEVQPKPERKMKKTNTASVLSSGVLVVLNPYVESHAPIAADAR